MHLTDAMVDIQTGNPIVPAEIILHLGKNPPIALPAHRHALLDFTRRPWSKVICRAVTGMHRLDSGFYAVTTAEPHFYLPFGRDMFGSEIYSQSRVAFQFACCGGFNLEREFFYSISECALLRRLEADGMAFAITGTFGPTSGPQSNAPPTADARFEIRGLVRWEMMRLYGFFGGLLHSLKHARPTKERHEAINPPESTDPLALADLLRGLDGPLVVGALTLSGAPSSARQATSHLVDFRCDAGGLALASCSRVERGPDGFCNRVEKGALRFKSTPITWPWIEQLLRDENDATVSLAGKGIGEVSYETGTQLAPGLPATVELQAERLAVDAALTKAGLNIQITALTGKTGLRSLGVRKVVEEPNDRNRFAAAVTVPWSHLLVMGSLLADRRGSFG